MSMTQYEARRALGAKLKKAHVSGLAPGTPLSLVWRRSYLDRPRYLGGRLTHEYDASCRQSGAKIRLTDRQLEEFVFPEANSSFQRR